MRLAFGSRAFRDYPLPETISILSQLGYEGVEIMADTPHAFPPELDADGIGRIKSALAAFRMGVSNLNASTLFALGDAEHPNWIEENEVLRERRIQHTIDVLHLGKQIGACMVSTLAGGALGEIPMEIAMERFVDGIRQVLPHCESNGIALIIEPKPGTLIERTDEFQELWDAIESPWLGLDLNIGHLYMVNEDPVTAIRDMGTLIWHVGIEDVPENLAHQHLTPGEGILDFVPVLEALAGMNYAGYVTVDLQGQGGSPEKQAEAAIEYLTRIAPASLISPRVVYA